MVKDTQMKQTEIGLIPEDWEVFKLNEISGVTRLAGYEYSKYWKEKVNGEIIGLRGFNIGKNKIIERDLVYISDELSKKLIRSRLFINDIIYPCVGTIGNAVVILENDKYHIQQNIAKITPKTQKIYPFYLSHFLMSDFGLKEIERFNGSSSQPNILVGSLRQYNICCPPLAEQEAIAMALSDCDAWIESLEAVIAKKRLIKQGAMQELLTPPSTSSGTATDGETVEPWEVKKLGEVCVILNNLRIPVKESNRTIGDTPYYGANGIQGYVEGFTHQGEFVLVAEDGANDLNNYPINYIRGKIWVNNHAHVLQGVISILSTRFLSYVLKSIDFQSVLVGGTRAKLNKNILEKIEVPFPSLSEQTRIATVLSDMDAELEALGQKLNKARQIKQGMMQELLTGRVRLV